MKKIKLFIALIIVCCFGLFLPSFVKTNATTLVTSADLSVTGAQVRVTGNAGIRFVGKVNEGFDKTNVVEYGIVLAYGEAVVSDVFAVGGTVNEKSTISIAVDEVKEDGTYFATLYNVPNVSYVKEITARAYVKYSDDTYCYATTITVRSLAQVSLAAANAGETKEGNLIGTVIEYVDNNYMIAGWNYEGNYAVKSSLVELDYKKLAIEFLSDYNKMFSTSLTNTAGSTLYASMKSNNNEAKNNIDITDSNLYKFFNNVKMNAKWIWLLNYIATLDTSILHHIRQIDAVKGDGINNNGLYNGIHLIYCIANFFNGGYETGGYNAVNFTNSSKYNTLSSFNNLFINSENYKFVKCNSSIVLPSALAPATGYEWDGYYLDTVKYNAGANYTISTSDVVFVPKFNATVPMDIIYVSSEANESFTYKSNQLRYNTNLFKTIGEAMDVVEEGKTVMVLPGIYNEDVTITKKVTLTTPNASINPTVSSTPFTSSTSKVVMTGKIYLTNAAENLSNITISGFTFTGGARIGFYSNQKSLSAFEYKNNYAYDTNDATLAFKYSAYGNGASTASTLNSTYPGFICLAATYGWVYNATIKDSVFKNVSDVNVYIDCTNGATITGNKFIDGDRDFIRFDYGSNNGVINIKQNSFENVSYNGIFLRSYGSGSSITVNTESNYFKNVATNSTKQFTSTIIGCFATAGYGEKAAAKFNFKYNIFEECGGYINIRSNVTNVSTWASKNYESDIQYNAFIQSTGTPKYYLNFLKSSDTSTTNKAIATFNNNYYGTSSTVKITPEQAQYEHVKSIDTTRFNTLEDLRTSVEALEGVFPVVVNNEDLVNARQNIDLFINNIGTIDTNITLPTSNSNCTIAWTSNNPTVLSNSGVYKRPYNTTDVTLTATFTKGSVNEIATYIVNVEGFKDLSQGIVAEYLYTSISSTSDYTYQNANIFFVAFGTAASDGTISNATSIGSTITNNVITKAHNNGAYVLLSINNATSLSDIAASSSIRTTFANNIVNFINTYNIDGIDIDWEFPASAEKENFTLLMQEIRSKVKVNNPNHLVTAATGIDTYTRYDFLNSSQYLDYICVMTYDMQSSAKATFHNALNYKSGKCYSAIERAETYYITNSEINPNKLILGVPFYGRYYNNVDGLSAASYITGYNSEGVPKYDTGTISYSSIKTNYLDNSAFGTTITRIFDNDCKVPYIYDSTNRKFISYEDPESIAIKVDYLKDNGWAGIFSWQDGQDSGDILFKSMVDNMNE